MGAVTLDSGRLILANQIRVLVVDDSAFMRKALSQEINADGRFTVVGTASDGREGVQKALELQPDVITLDVEMPVQGGLETLRQLAAKSSAAVIMVSAPTERSAEIMLDALALGAVDFIPKSQGTVLLREKLLVAASVRRKRSTGASGPTVPSGPGNAVLGEPPSLPKDFFPNAIVIGSSTGGPQALTEIFIVLASPLPVPVIISHHMPPPFTAALAHRLNAQTGHNVLEAKDGDAIVDGTVYVAPGGLQMRVKEGTVSVRPDTGESLYQPSIDVLAASVSEAYGKNVLAIMLTGLGHDGTKEFTSLKNAGAWTIAQDSSSCAVFGMPKSLIEAGGACESVPLRSIGHRIATILVSRLRITAPIAEGSHGNSET